MDKFRDRDSGGFKGRKFHGGNRPPWKKDYHDDERERPAMHRATCDKCGKDCEVPFVPSGKKPVFCRECFVKEDSGAPKHFDRKPPFRGPSFAEKTAPQIDYREPLKAIADKLEVIAKALNVIVNRAYVAGEPPEVAAEPVEEKLKRKAKTKKKK